MSGHPAKPPEMLNECRRHRPNWGWPWQGFCQSLPKFSMEDTNLLTYWFATTVAIWKTTQKMRLLGFAVVWLLPANAVWYSEPKPGTTGQKGPRRRRRRRRKKRRMRSQWWWSQALLQLIKRVVRETESTNAECGMKSPDSSYLDASQSTDSTLSLAPEVSELQLMSN